MKIIYWKSYRLEFDVIIELNFDNMKIIKIDLSNLGLD